MVDIEDKAIQGIRQALGSIGLREAAMHRPQPIPPAILKLLREVHAPELKPKPETQNQASGDLNATVVGPGLIPVAEQDLESIARLPPEKHERAFQELEAARIKGEMEVAAGLGGRCRHSDRCRSGGGEAIQRLATRSWADIVLRLFLPWKIVTNPSA